MCSNMMYSEITTENFNKIKQIIQKNGEEMLKLFPYLFQDKIMSQEELEKEAVKVMERIINQLPNGNFNKISSQENIQEGLRFINLVNEIYILSQQEKKILQEEDQSIQQLQQAEERVKEVKIQLRYEEEHLREVKKKLIPMQEKLKLINKQKNLFTDVLNNNKEIVMQKLIVK